MNRGAQEVFVKLAYAIGVPEPVMAVAIVDGVETILSGYDLSPRGIRELLRLDEVEYKKTAEWGHFGRGFGWDE